MSLLEEIESLIHAAHNQPRIESLRDFVGREKPDNEMWICAQRDFTKLTVIQFSTCTWHNGWYWLDEQKRGYAHDPVVVING